MRYNCQENRRYTWCPEDSQGKEHLILRQYLEEAAGPQWGAWWLAEIDHLAQRARCLGIDGLPRLIRKICRFDSGALTELLFSRYPELFLYPLGNCCWNAVGLSAFYGNIVVLETLLEAGADPNELDTVKSWPQVTYQSDDGSRSLFVLTPLDLARLGRNEECRFLLELYGGRSARGLYEIPEEEQAMLAVLTASGWGKFLGVPELEGAETALLEMWREEADDETP